MYVYCFISAGRPPLGQMPFIVTPEGKCLAESGAIMKYICKKAGNNFLGLFIHADLLMLCGHQWNKHTCTDRCKYTTVILMGKCLIGQGCQSDSVILTVLIATRMY